MAHPYTLVVYRYTGRSPRPSKPQPDTDRHLAHTPSPQVDRPAVVADVAPFRRDAPTVLSYAALASYTFWLYAFGPSLALLREELQFSYTLLGVYSALWSVGAALAGAGFALATRRLPRAALLWCSALAAVVGAGLFTLGSGVAATLLGAGVLGLAGTTLLTVIQAILSDRPGPHRARALTEANVGAGACAVLAPLVLGALAASPAGWRATFAVPVVVLAALYLHYRRRPLPAASQCRGTERPGRLPLACWLFAALTAAGMAVEFCLVYFGTEMLIDTGLSTAVAATALSSNYLGILVGRLAGAVLTAAPAGPFHCCTPRWRSPPPASCCSGSPTSQRSPSWGCSCAEWASPTSIRSRSRSPSAPPTDTRTGPTPAPSCSAASSPPPPPTCSAASPTSTGSPLRSRSSRC